jgi:hypothetical protein
VNRKKRLGLIIPGRSNETFNSHNLELVLGDYPRQAEQHYSEQQIPATQQPVHLMMAGQAETSADNERRRENINRRCTQTAKK